MGAEGSRIVCREICFNADRIVRSCYAPIWTTELRSKITNSMRQRVFDGYQCHVSRFQDTASNKIPISDGSHIDKIFLEYFRNYTPALLIHKMGLPSDWKLISMATSQAWDQIYLLPRKYGKLTPISPPAKVKRQMNGAYIQSVLHIIIDSVNTGILLFKD